MKKKLYLIIIVLLTSCIHCIDDDIEIDKKNELHVVTRAASDISFPLILYAFDAATGSLVSNTKIISYDEELTLYLGTGIYRLVAVAGAEECNVKKSPVLNDVLTMPNTNRLSTPLQMGSADVNVNKDTTVNITLYNQVTAINLSLEDIPTDINSINVTFSTLHTELDFNGTFSGSGNTTVKLAKKANGSWQSERFYTFPGNTKKIVLSITTEGKESTTTYGYTHNVTLEANTPYLLMGSYESGFTINGVVNLAGWKDPQTINFTFGTNSSSTDEEDEENNNSEMEAIIVSEIPVVGKIWDNHFIAAVQDVTSTEAVLLLLSLKEWTDITSATNAETPKMATELVTSYTEEGLKNWSIPTREEAKVMYSNIGMEALTNTNSTLISNNIAPLSIGEDEKGTKIRYLCDDATFTYAWDNTNISKAGTKRTYHLRAVKRVKVVKK